MTRGNGSDYSVPLGAIYVLFLQEGSDEPVRNYTKIMMPESEGALFGVSLANTFDIDGNGEGRVWGRMGW